MAGAGSIIATIAKVVLLSVLIVALTQLPEACSSNGALEFYFPPNCSTWLLKKEEQMFCEEARHCTSVSHALAGAFSVALVVVWRSLWQRPSVRSHQQMKVDEDSEWEDIPFGQTQSNVVNIKICARGRRRVRVLI